MIIYKDILEKLKDAGYSTYRLRKDKLIAETSIQRLRENRPITTETIDVICNLLDCDISDILEHIKE